MIGREAGQKVLNYYNHNSPDSTSPQSSIPLKYELMNTVPGNWIPFIPVSSGQWGNRQIQLKRGAMQDSLKKKSLVWLSLKPIHLKAQIQIIIHLDYSSMRKKFHGQE
jgi:hypothetical protein